MKDAVPFTYYGSLLGIPASYVVAPGATYHKLERFYNLAYDHFKDVCGGFNVQYGAHLFSYSILFFGEDLLEGLALLKSLYVDLLAENLMLRGSVLPGRMQFDPRFSLKNFHNFIPRADVLERAAVLAAATKGARLILHQDVARPLFPSDSGWETEDGFVEGRDKHPEIGKFDPRRFISPVEDGQCYEYLYFYRDPQHPRVANDETVRRLGLLNDPASKSVAEHFEATTDLLQRCRQRSTLKPALNAANQGAATNSNLPRWLA